MHRAGLDRLPLENGYQSLRDEGLMVGRLFVSFQSLYSSNTNQYIVTVTLAVVCTQNDPVLSISVQGLTVPRSVPLVLLPL